MPRWAKTSLNTNAKMVSVGIASGVMGVNPDSILTVKDVMSKNVDNIGNAEMGINIMEENVDSCDNSAVMCKNVINTETNVSTKTTNTTIDTEKTVCQQNNIMCSDALTSPIDPYLDARLSGALEQLNPSEMTALNTLVFMGIQPPITTESSSYEIEHAYSMAVGDHRYCQLSTSADTSINPTQKETSSLHDPVMDEANTDVL